MSHINIKPWTISASDIFISKARLTERYAGDSDGVWHKISFSINSRVKELFNKCRKLAKLLHLKGNLIVWLWGGISPGAWEDRFQTVLLYPHKNDSVLMRSSHSSGQQLRNGSGLKWEGLLSPSPRKGPECYDQNHHLGLLAIPSAQTAAHFVGCLACSVSV